MSETQPSEEIRQNWINQTRNMGHAYEEREPTSYIVDPIIEAGSLNILYGAPATMKSLLAADMASSIVMGQDWLPGAQGKGMGYQTKSVPVSWFDLDNGKRRTDERKAAVGKAHGLPEDAQMYYLSMPVPTLIASDMEVMEAMIQYVRDDIKAGLIIIDNLGLITGDVEENSAQMAKVMGYLRILAEGTGAAIILIHHQRKGGAGGSRPGDALRGHSSIEASLDLALHVVREPGSSEIVIQSTKTRGVDVPRTVARFNFEHRSGTNDLEKAWFDGVAPVQDKNPIRDAILEIVNVHGEITKGRLVDAVADSVKHHSQAPGVNKIRNWVGEMVNGTGELIEVKQGNSRLIMTPNHHRENFGIV